MKIKLYIYKNKLEQKTFYLSVDLGYTRKNIIKYDTYAIAELLRVSIHQLQSLDVGEYDVGTLYGLDNY